MSLSYKKPQDFEETKLIVSKNSSKEASLQLLLQESIYLPHKESFNIVPTVMSVNATQDRLLIGGSHMLKLYKITDNMCLSLLEKNLSHKFHALSRSTIKDVAWNPRMIKIILLDTDQSFAVVTTERKVLILDCESPNKIIAYNDTHRRMINKLIWSPEMSNHFLTISSDNQMKMYGEDTRTPLFTLSNQSAGYLDAKFAKWQPNLLAAAKDNGEIEVWDLRNNNTLAYQGRVHIAPVSSLDWNPLQRYALITGSLDRHVKVHNLVNQVNIEQVMDIGLYSSVSAVKWYEDSKYDFDVSFGQNNEVSLFHYNLLSPHIPLSVYKGHTDIITGFSWVKNNSYLITCSKDCNVIVRHKSYAVHPLLEVKTVGVSLGKDNTLAYHSNNFFSRVLS